MIHVLTGANDFMRKERRQELVRLFVKEYGDISLEIIDCEEAEFDRIRESLESLPFLSVKKLVVLRRPSSNKEFLENAHDLLDNLPDSTDVIIDEPKLDKRSRYYTFIKKLDGYEEFSELDSAGLARWAGEYVKKWQASIDQAAARELIARLGTDQLKLSHELDKLCMYTEKIDRTTMESLTVRTPSSTIFELIDAAFSDNKQRALELYEEQRALQVDPIQVVAMFAWQFHVLAIVKTAGSRSQSDIAKQAKLNPYVVQKTSHLANKRTLSQIKTNVHELRILDRKMKTQRINVDDALRAYIVNL